jgi:hypothetical protein
VAWCPTAGPQPFLDLPAGRTSNAHADLVDETVDIPLLGGPGDGQSVTVPVDDDRMPPAILAALVIEDQGTPPRIEGSYLLEPQAGGTGPPWLYVYSLA